MEAEVELDNAGTKQLGELKLPEALQNIVAIDRPKRLVFVEQRFRSDPHLLTWIKKNKNIGVDYCVDVRPINEIQEMIQRGLADQPESGDVSQAVLDAARELIERGAKYRANNIHMMMRGDHTEIQFTVNGSNRQFKLISQDEGIRLSRAIYQGLAQTRDAGIEMHKRQSATITAKATLFDPQLNLSTIRAIRGPSFPVEDGGQFMTLRLQYESLDRKKAKHEMPALAYPPRPEGDLELKAMGYSDGSIKKLLRLLSTPNGMIIFTGPTGCGKTTTLVELLYHLARLFPDRRIVTVEDPAEYILPFAVRQIVTDAKTEEEAGEQYLDMVRAALRMEPHVFYLGELRGARVTLAAIAAVLSAHQVWTTTHAIDPFLIPDRIENMDQRQLNRKVYCDPKIIRGMVTQRLLPHLCPDCSIPLSDAPDVLDKEEISFLETWGDIRGVRVKGPGCEHCNGEGTISQFAVAEVVMTDQQLMDDFINLGSARARQRYYERCEDADEPLYVAAMKHVLGGHVDPSAFRMLVDWIVPKPGSMPTAEISPLVPTKGDLLNAA